MHGSTSRSSKSLLRRSVTQTFVELSSSCNHLYCYGFVLSRCAVCSACVLHSSCNTPLARGVHVWVSLLQTAEWQCGIGAFLPKAHPERHTAARYRWRLARKFDVMETL